MRECVMRGCVLLHDSPGLDDDDVPGLLHNELDILSPVESVIISIAQYRMHYERMCSDLHVL